MLASFTPAGEYIWAPPCIILRDILEALRPRREYLTISTVYIEMKAVGAQALYYRHGIKKNILFLNKK
jgi:hypothetical protein